MKVGHFVGGQCAWIDQYFIHQAVQIEAALLAADGEGTGTLIGGRCDITRHLHPIKIDGAFSGLRVEGTGPVVPARVGVSSRGVEIVLPKGAGKYIVRAEPKLQALIVLIFPLPQQHLEVARGRTLHPCRKCDALIFQGEVIDLQRIMGTVEPER